MAPGVRSLECADSRGASAAPRRDDAVRSNIDKRSYYAPNKRFGCIDYGRDDANDPASSAAGPSPARTVRRTASSRTFTITRSSQRTTSSRNTDKGYGSAGAQGQLNHAPGLGKTYAAIAAMATVKLAAVPEGVEGKALILPR